MKNNKLLFSPYSLQSFVSVESSGKSEKPRGHKNNLVEKLEPIDSSDSQRHRAAEHLRAKCQWSLEPSFPGAVPQGNLRMEQPVSKKKPWRGWRWQYWNKLNSSSENKDIGQGSREHCLQPVQTTVKANSVNAFPVILLCWCSITMSSQECKVKKVQWFEQKQTTGVQITLE